MDSITQAVLGASVGGVVLGPKIGNRALLAGAVIGSLPDADVLFPFTDAVATFTYHRSFSHSFIVLTILTPVLLWFMELCKRKRFEHRRSWLLMIFLAFNTHVLLDCFTIYGTQAFWPLNNYPVGWGTIFIIDPLYTAPLLLGVIITAIAMRGKKGSHTALKAGLMLSSAYLCVTIVLHHTIEQHANEQLAGQNIQPRALLTAPTPMSLLWRIVARTETDYYEGYYSVFDSDKNIEFVKWPAGESNLQGLSGHWPVERLRWFTKGLYATSLENDQIVISDLRMGIESQYVFRFSVAQTQGDKVTPVIAQLLPFIPDIPRMKKVLARVTDENVSID